MSEKMAFLQLRKKRVLNFLASKTNEELFLINSKKMRNHFNKMAKYYFVKDILKDRITINYISIKEYHNLESRFNISFHLEYMFI